MKTKMSNYSAFFHNDKKAGKAVEIILELCDLVGTTKFFLYIEDEDDKLNYINSLISAVYNNEDALGNPNISFLPDFLEDHVENFMLNVIIPAMVKYVIKKL